MADPKVEALRRLAGYKARKEMKDGEQMEDARQPNMLDRILDYAGRPAAATRSAVSAMQEGQDAKAAFMEQLGRPSSEAPTGADIAERLSEAQGIENPYVLGAIATAADVALDPLNLIPGGAMRHAAKGAKKIKGMGKGERALSQVGDIKFPAKSPAKAMRVAEALKKEGRVPKEAVLTVGERMPIQAKEALLGKDSLRKADIPKKELDKVLEDFPKLRSLKKYGGTE